MFVMFFDVAETTTNLKQIRQNNFDSFTQIQTSEKYCVLVF